MAAKIKVRVRPGRQLNGSGGRVYRPGQELYLRPHQVEAFRGTVEPIESDVSPTQDDVEKKAGHQEMLYIQHRASGWYDVISKYTGEKINENALRIEEARELVSECQSSG